LSGVFVSDLFVADNHLLPLILNLKNRTIIPFNKMAGCPMLRQVLTPLRDFFFANIFGDWATRMEAAS
jgi:hypothetical protein